MKGPKQVLQAATLWEEGFPLDQFPYTFNNVYGNPKNSRKCRFSVDAARTGQDARFWISRANVSKSGETWRRG